MNDVVIDLPIPTYEHTVDGRELIVLDDVLTPDEVAAMARAYTLAAYVRSESDQPELQHLKTFVVDTEIHAFIGTPLQRCVTKLIERHFSGEALELYRAHCNLTVYGDMTHPHRDCAADRHDLTALYFANDRWEVAWGGETIFYNDRDDTVFAVNPRPGRLIIFRGAIMHRVGVPTRECYASRLTYAIKFKSPGEWR